MSDQPKGFDPFHVFVSYFAFVVGSQLCAWKGVFLQSELKDVVNADGQSYPIGFWLNDWSAGHLTVEVARVLIQETR